MDYQEIDAFVNGILNSSKAVKQDLGRRFAAYLGLMPGNAGRDGGIDGSGKINNKTIYFQSKLFKKRLDASFAADFVGNLVTHEADIGIMLAGIGYTDGFIKRLNQAFQSKYEIHTIKIHLLSLEDVFGESDQFEKATLDLPPLRDLSNGEWAKFK